MVTIYSKDSRTKEDFIKECEIDYFNQLGELVDRIVNEKCRVVLLAGPSGSGKTTTGLRLQNKLKEVGVSSLLLSMDNWYATRQNLKSIIDENGNIDYESPYCVDIDLFNQNLDSLLSGEIVNSPEFDFVTGTQKITDKELSVSEDEIIIIEGLHAFNDYVLLNTKKMYVYVCPDSLYIDGTVKIFSEEIRLYRRLSRDKLNRGRSFKETIDMWESVERGTEKYLKPNLYKTDVEINSLLGYEIFIHHNVLGDFQKLKRVDNLNINVDNIPESSILNEFFKRN